MNERKKNVLVDLLIALTIGVALFYMMITVVDTAEGADFRPGLMPQCQDMHQKTMKEVLSCD